MKEPTKVTEIPAIERTESRLCSFCRSILALPRSSGARSLWQQSASQQIQICQREGAIQPGGVLRQATVANFAKAPEALDHVEYMFDTGPRSGAATVDESLVFTQVTGTAVDPIADALGQGGLTMRFTPVRLVAEHLALLA